MSGWKPCAPQLFVSLVTDLSRLLSSYGQDEADETFYEPEENVEEFAPDADIDEAAIEDRANGGEGDERTVVTGDPNQNAQKPSSDADKKIPNEKRTTTPYMTKYERARVLGTRALQIR